MKIKSKSNLKKKYSTLIYLTSK